MSVKIALFPIFVLTIFNTAHAFERKDGTYFCTVEFVGGIAYDKRLKKWDGARFNAEGKFILKLSFVKSRKETYSAQSSDNFDDYTATIAEAGKNIARPCTNGRLQPVSMDEFGYLSCSSSLSDYKFNMKNNRFMSAYLVGFINGEDNNNDTPAISGGTCTKIN